MNKDLIEKTHHQTVESLKQEGEDGCEFWSARKLSKALEYYEYRNFLPVIEKAKKACKNSGHATEDHFVQVNEMVEIGSGGQRQVGDVKLSRYACYLIVQNGDPAKPVIANGQTYFAIQTRRQELADSRNFQQLKEDEKRLFLRNELCEHNKLLVETAQQAGVETPLDLKGKQKKTQQFENARHNISCLVTFFKVNFLRTNDCASSATYPPPKKK